MKIRFLCFALLSIFLIACSSKQDARQKIEKAENALYGKNDEMDFDEKKVENTINAYKSFAKEYQSDSMAPEYLFKAADLYRLKDEPKKALTIYQKIRDKHKDFRKAAHCLFLQGFVFENEIGDLNKARKKYQEFIDEYPDHELADDARFSLKNLGKSPEEIIDNFDDSEKKAQAESEEQKNDQETSKN